MRRFLSSLLGGRLQKVLIASFALVAGLTVGLSTWGTSRVIQEYLAKAESEVVKRDMSLAKAFYELKLDEMAAISHRLALDPWVIRSFPAASRGDRKALQVIDQQIINKVTVLALGGTHLIAILNTRGNIIVGRVLSQSGTVSTMISGGVWGQLPIVQEVLRSAVPKATAEVVPVEFLSQVGLDKQAHIPLIETRLAAPKPFDLREGSGGFTLAGVYPIHGRNQQMIGAVLSLYLFNNDFTLVDRIKEVAGIDTVTLFFGDLRVATNVVTEEGKRAVGTRIAEAVGNVVLYQGRDYIGRAYVVKEWFITWYTPLFDGRGQVVGSLYVGARESAFLQLVHNFNERVILIALICILLAGVIAVPTARRITKPIDELVQANRRLAEGDMAVRVHTPGRGELAMLGRSFNSMVDTLERTQRELLHKEKLASMGQLAAGVAHEINNPLGSILLFAGMLYKETKEGDPRREDLKMILHETHRCKNIVADLLNFSRQQGVLVQDSHVNDILEQVVSSARQQPSFQKVEIIRNLAADLPAIQVDPAQLIQVFVNLLNNAAEAMPEGGTITLGSRLMDSQRVEITISDTGCGISEENLGKLFTPFFTTKPIGKGTGLGLSIVYGIIKMHRGQITVKSAMGQGTTFTVTLPLTLPKPQPPMPESVGGPLTD